jgi:hypothetical protein
MRAPDRICIALFLGVAACSGAAPATFGGGSHDATTVPEAGPVEMEAESPVDATVGDEPRVEKDSGIKGYDAEIESGTGIEIDAGDDGMAPSLCATICTGCCDKMGRCQTGNTTNACGVMGAACENCTTNKGCPLTEAPCCGSKGCGCAVAGLIGCN